MSFVLSISSALSLSLSCVLSMLFVLSLLCVHSMLYVLSMPCVLNMQSQRFLKLLKSDSTLPFNAPPPLPPTSLTHTHAQQKHPVSGWMKKQNSPLHHPETSGRLSWLVLDASPFSSSLHPEHQTATNTIIHNGVRKRKAITLSSLTLFTRQCNTHCITVWERERLLLLVLLNTY